MIIINAIKTTGLWISIVGLLTFSAGCSSTPEERMDIPSNGRLPNIRPDYSGIIIPPNIAPLNFTVKDSGQNYVVHIHSKEGETIRIESSNGQILIPIDPWKRMLAANPGRQLIVDVFVKNQNGHWSRFDPVIDQIASESIDGYLTYRRFGNLFNDWSKMGIFQRCLETFEEKPVLLNRQTQGNCMNCHNFWQNGTDRWLLHLRGGPTSGLLLCVDGKISKIDTRTAFNKAAGAFPAWHPSGNLIAFSINKQTMFYHAIGETRDVVDKVSDIILYDIPTNTITTAPELSSPDFLENWPVWSRTGDYLYFCRAPKMEAFINGDKFAYDKIRYDLMRIAYDAEKHTWGKLETVLSAAEMGMSISQPRISPDGRFLIFIGSQYGQLVFCHTDADLYLLDLTNGRRKKLELNSGQSDSFHSISSNGRWIAFTSRRQDGQYARPFISHFDSLGNASKAFIVPQSDPCYYDKCLEIFNVPELGKEPIRISPQALAKAAFSNEDALAAKLDPNVVSPKTNDGAQSAAPSKFRARRK
jgi:hypothetical protein